MNMCRSPPMKIITDTTMMPDTSPTPVMISMENSDAHANTGRAARLDGPF
jgi:hypothetical protein